MIILPANTLSTGAFSVDNSCRFNDGDSPHMTKTPSAGDVDKWTLSFWVKRGQLATQMTVFSGLTDSNNYAKIQFESTDQLHFYNVTSASTDAALKTNRLFRDPSAWYSIVCVWDSANGTAGNRMRLYVNGTEETSFATDTNPSSGLNSHINAGVAHYVGQEGDRSKYFDGYLAEMIFCDGQAYAGTDFGEFDEDSPTIFKPKKFSGSFGTNGFHLDFEASDNLGNDANGGTDLAETNLAAIDQCSDSPTNNFCTWNSASQYGGAFSEGNTKSTGTGHYNPMGTFGMAKGKWYWENYLSGSHITCGVAEAGVTPTNAASQSSYPFWLIYDNGGATYKYPNPTSGDNITAVTSLGNFASGVTVGLAFDADAKKLWASFNGTYYDGGSGTGDPAAGSNELFGSVEPQFGGTIVPACGVGTANSEKSINVNFGNPSVSISSGNADADGYGNFEFAVPSGFYALCTKNLAEYG